MAINEFFTSVQEAAESGGKQFDKSGKTLVGRYRDGTTPKGDKKAYGRGQMQIGTARDTAKRHGIDWDESKFMRDGDYNVSLANLHMKDLVTRYKGDRELAVAAYHQGQGTVDKALAKFGRANYIKGIGPEGRAYVKKIMGGQAGGQQGNQAMPGTTQRRSVLDDIENFAASGNVRQQDSAIFGSGERLSQETAEVRRNLGEQSQRLDVLQQVTEAAQLNQMTHKVRQVEDSRAISDEIVGATNELKRQIKPVFEARQRVADQLDKINTMNPLERGIRGIFDLNYDKNHLTNQLDNFDRTIKMRGEDFNFSYALNSKALTEIDRRYGIDTAIADLSAEHAKSDLGIANIRLAQANDTLGATKAEIQTQAQVISAQKIARENMMGQLDLPTVTELLVKAQQGNGVVEYNGTQLNAQELRERVQNMERYDMSVRSAELALQAQEMNLYAQHTRNALGLMTREQVEAVAANGGVDPATGLQFQADDVTRALQNYQTRTQMEAEQIALQIPGAQAAQAASAMVGEMTGLYYRAKSMMGNHELRGSALAMREVSEIATQLDQAVKSGADPLVIRTLLDKLDQSRAAYSKQIDSTILRSVGGDKEVAQIVKSFTYGTPINEVSATNALVTLALKGSLPQGVTLSPEAREVFQKVQQTVQANRIDEKGKPRSKQQLASIVSSQVGQIANQVVGNTRLQMIMENLPAHAADFNNPLSQLEPKVWNQIRQNATRQADIQIAERLQTSPQNIQQMRTKFKPVDSTPQSAKLWTDFNQQSGTYNAMYQSELVRLIDEQPNLQPGVANSELMVDFMQSPEMVNRGQQITERTSNASIGDYLVNPIAQSALTQVLHNEAQGLDAARGEFNESQRLAARDLQKGYGFSSQARISTIMSSIPGVGPEGAAKLRPFVNQVIGSPVKRGVVETGMEVGGIANRILNPMLESIDRGRQADLLRAQERAVVESLQATKFQDPAMEAYRKAVVKNWKEYADSSDSFVTNLWSNLTGR